MTRPRPLFVVPLLAFISLSSYAQTTTQTTRDEELHIPRSSDPGKTPFVRDFVVDEYRMWTSPFRRSSYSARAFTKYVVPFTIITGVLIATDHKSSNALPNTVDQSTWSGRVSQIGAPYTLGGMALTMYLVSKATGDKKARETGFLGAEAIAHSQLITLGMKEIFQRDRPLIFKEKNEGGIAFFRGGNSFPSGHSSGSFALATVFAYEYGPDHHWVPYVSYGLASVVSISRLSAQKHWLSDIFVGGSMGFLVGRYVYRHHHDPRLDGRPATRLQKLEPEFGVTNRGLTLSWNL